jgi:isopenicillin-N epimerase
MNFSQYWSLKKDIYYLNHGSFGATPIPVLEYQNSLREKLESQPLHFLARELEGLLDAAKQKLGEFVGVASENLAFVPNTTFGVNSVLRSLSFRTEDEILITNHTYNACNNVVNFIANRTGVKIVIAEVPFPLDSPQQIIEPILAHTSERTKLVFLDHITSQTALIFPIETLINELNNRGIDTLIDGAHAPGAISLNIQALNVAYYTGNCHKWLCAPKGAGFLYVRPDKQQEIHPLAISHGANSPRRDRSRFQLEFDWLGTDDPTAYLSVAKSIEFMDSLLPGGWTAVREHNHQLTLKARKLLTESLQVNLPCPDEMIGSMASIPLGNISFTLEEIYHKLLTEFKIEVPIMPWSSPQLLRISAQIYNSIEQYEYLAEVLQKLIYSM